MAKNYRLKKQKDKLRKWESRERVILLHIMISEFVTASYGHSTLKMIFFVIFYCQ